MTTNTELKLISNGTAGAVMEVQSRHLSKETEENHDTLMLVGILAYI
jgi:hypothetical protein